MRKALGMGHQIAQLGRLPTIGKHQHGVFTRDHAKVAVARLARMNEIGRRAGGGQGSGDLAGDVAALAHAADDHAAFDSENGIDGAR